jgi:hypothetical protein
VLAKNLECNIRLGSKLIPDFSINGQYVGGKLGIEYYGVNFGSSCGTLSLTLNSLSPHRRTIVRSSMGPVSQAYIFLECL